MKTNATERVTPTRDIISKIWVSSFTWQEGMHIISHKGAQWRHFFFTIWMFISTMLKEGTSFVYKTKKCELIISLLTWQLIVILWLTIKKSLVKHWKKQRKEYFGSKKNSGHPYLIMPVHSITVLTGE